MIPALRIQSIQSGFDIILRPIGIGRTCIPERSFRIVLVIVAFPLLLRTTQVLVSSKSFSPAPSHFRVIMGTEPVFLNDCQLSSS
jgi:hypothetical protein